MLGAESVRRFEEHGWLSLPRVFDGDEVASISDEFEATMSTYANGFNAVAEEGETHDGSVWTFISGGIEHTPAMCALLDEPRICDSVTALLGEDWNYAGGDGAFYTGDTSFHVDNDHCIHHGGMFSLKVAIYLDEVGPGQGVSAGLQRQPPPRPPAAPGGQRPRAGGGARPPRRRNDRGGAPGRRRRALQSGRCRDLQP